MKKIFLVLIILAICVPLFGELHTNRIKLKLDNATNDEVLKYDSDVRRWINTADLVLDSLWLRVGEFNVCAIDTLIINDTLYITGQAVAVDTFIIDSAYVNKLVVHGFLTLDDGVGDSPLFKLIDADNKYLSIQKLDTGNTVFINDEGDIKFDPAGLDILLDAGLTIGSDTEAGDNNLRVEGNANIIGTLDAPTVNTGQGDYELYAMNQDVESTNAVTFATVNTGEGANELFDMNQNVTTTSDVVFDSLYVTKIKAGGGTDIEGFSTDTSLGTSNDSLSTQGAIKTYTDALVTAQDLDFSGDSGTGAIDLDSETFKIKGTANKIVTSATGDSVTLDITLLKDIVTTAPITGGTNNILVGADSDITIAITTDKDIVAGDGLEGGENDVLPGADADVELAINMNVAGGIETIDDSLNIKLDGSTLVLSSSGIKVDSDAIGDTQLAYNTGQHLTTTSDVVHDSLYVRIITTDFITSRDSTEITIQDDVVIDSSLTITGKVQSSNFRTDETDHLIYIGDTDGAASGTNYVFIGENAGEGSSGNGCNAVGINAAQNNSGANSNAFGNASLQGNTGVQCNAFGDGALGHNNTGMNCGAFGDDALRDNTANSCNAFGMGALYENVGLNSTAMGNSALSRNTGARCSAFGYSALSGNVGDYSNALGGNALYYNCVDSSNAVGGSALYYNQGANSNALGHKALYSNQGANSNAMGSYSLWYNYGANSNAIGTKALQFNTGTNSNGIGYSTLQYNDGNYNSALGDSAFNNFTEDAGSAEEIDTVIHATNRVTITGHGFGEADTYLNLVASTTDTLPTGLDTNPQQWMVVDANTLECQTDTFSDVGVGTHTLTPKVIYSNSTALGYNAQPDASNQIVLGDGNVTEVKTFGNIEGTGYILSGGNGSEYNLQTTTEEVTIAIGSGLDPVVVTSGNLAPANCLIKGIAFRVTQAPGGGATTLDIGITGGDLDAYIDGASCDVLGEVGDFYTNGNVGAPIINRGAATTLTLTADADVTGTDMKIRVIVFYETITSPQN